MTRAGWAAALVLLVAATADARGRGRRDADRKVDHADPDDRAGQRAGAGRRGGGGRRDRDGRRGRDHRADDLPEPSPPDDVVADDIMPEVDLAAVEAEPGPAAEPVVARRAPDTSRKRFYVRAGVAFVQTLERSSEMELSDIDGPASLAVQSGPIAGSGAAISSATAFAATIGWRTPWLDHRLSIETIVGIPFTVKFEATGTLANDPIAPTALGLPTGVPPLGPQLGEARALPVVGTTVIDLVSGSRVRPYLGGGVALMFTAGAKVTNPLLMEVGTPEMKIDPAPGLVFQGGIDAMLTRSVYARLDLKFIALMRAHARVEHVQVRTPDLPLFETVEVGTAELSAWLNPLIVQAGIGTDF